MCPADFCDLIRCEVLQFAALSKTKNQTGDFQSQQDKQQTITALVKASPAMHTLNRFKPQADRCLTDVEHCKRKGWLVLPSQLPEKHCCSPAPLPPPANPPPNQTDCRPNSTSDFITEAILPNSKEEELSARIKQKQSACKDEDFVQLRSDCARLIGLCTSGLALQMTNQQFSLLRGE